MGNESSIESVAGDNEARLFETVGLPLRIEANDRIRRMRATGEITRRENCRSSASLRFFFFFFFFISLFLFILAYVFSEERRVGECNILRRCDRGRSLQCNQFSIGMRILKNFFLRENLRFFETMKTLTIS